MIISFTLENWMSFRDPVTFSMVATKERRHGGRIPKLRKYGTKVLPIAAIYGGNASGKSNFFKAMAFAQSLVVNITQIDEPISVEPFCLDADEKEHPTRFAFELLIDEIIYEFSFAVTSNAVVEEKLVKITGNKEENLYSRPGKPANPLLQTVFDSTRDNQLFLTNSVSQKASDFRKVYDWFKGTLKLIAPDFRAEMFEQVLDDGYPLHVAMNKMISQLDTGIVNIEVGNFLLERNELSESENNFFEHMKEGVLIPMLNQQGVFYRKEGKLIIKKWTTSHQKTDGTITKFEMRQESDGTQRVIHLLPHFFDLSGYNSNRVYIIDEIDRSLHTLLTRRLIEGYLASCSAKTRSQLLLTTHDVLLMDKQLLRHDEMWVAERDASGASTLYSFSEYKDAEKDKDIRKSYLQGRLGGIPRLLMNGPLRQCKSEEAE